MAVLMMYIEIEKQDIVQVIMNDASVWFKLTVTVMEMTINGNKSNLLTVTITVTEIPLTEIFS